jgi:DNA-binding transcriptional MerR regulator
MNKIYRTNEISKIIGIHNNTVHRYEEWGFITAPIREKNGYRVFNELHIYQFKFARLALKCEIVENGLRKDAIEIIKSLAKKQYDLAINLINKYMFKIDEEECKSIKAINTVSKLLKRDNYFKEKYYTKKEVLEILDLKPDTLRNWERNGLIKTSKKANGYKIYSDRDVHMINIIRTLRLANYSLAAILRMTYKIKIDKNVDVKNVIDIPDSEEEIVSACDKLLTSLKQLKSNTVIMKKMLEEIKAKF